MQRLFLLAAVGIGLTGAAFAQGDKLPVTTPADVQAQKRPQDDRANLLKQLGLAPDQMRRIRMFNQEHGPLMKAAQARLKDANQALDASIYADNVNDADVEARLKDAQIAQAEVARIRSMNELGIRRVLTPEQLLRFRMMRQRFEEARQNESKPVRNTFQPKPGPMRRILKQNGQRP